MEIKDGCHAAIVLLAAAAMLLDRNTGIASRLLGALCVSAPMLALTLVIPGAFGGGDIKLMAAAGLFWDGGTRSSQRYSRYSRPVCMCCTFFQSRKQTEISALPLGLFYAQEWQCHYCGET